MVHILSARFWGGRFHCRLVRSGKAMMGGRHWAYTEALKHTGRTKIFYSEECKMWSKRGKISYFHDHFKTPFLEVLELKFPKVRSHRPPKAKLSYITLFAQFWIAVEGGKKRTFKSCWKWIILIGPFFAFTSWSLQIKQLVRKRVRKSYILDTAP